MWHEARRQERKIRGMLVDYRRRAERRRDFYEKIKADPTQFLQVHGRQCKIHLDAGVAAAADSPATMMPWQGQADNLIDRFDVRAHLDYIPPVKKQEEPDLTYEERQVNYESYRVIAQNSFLSINEEKFLKQLQMEEQFGYTETETKKKKSGGVAIGFNYEDGTGTSSTGTVNHEEDSDGNSDSDLDVDLYVNVSKIDQYQAHEMNKHGLNYGMSTNDFYSFLTNDMEEAENNRIAREEENEKALFSGRKSRRERRAHREKRLANRVISPPSYAARTSPTYPTFRESKSISRSPSPDDAGKITYITSFGDEEEPSSSAKLSYADKVKQNLKSRRYPSSSPEVRAVSFDKRKRSRSKERKYKRRRSRSTESRSPRGRYRRSRSKNRAKSRSRSRDRKYNRRSTSSSSSSISSRSVSSSRSRSPSMKRSKSSSSSYRSVSLRRSRSRSRKRDSPPKVSLPRYYGRKRSDQSSSSDLEDVEDENKPVSNSNTGTVYGNTGTAIKKNSGSFGMSFSIQERLKRKRQALLNKQFKADKLAEQLKTAREKQEQMNREDELREIAIKLRRRQRELRHAYDSHNSSSSSDSDDNIKSPSKNRSRSGSNSPKNKLDDREYRSRDSRKHERRDDSRERRDSRRSSKSRYDSEKRIVYKDDGNTDRSHRRRDDHRRDSREGRDARKDDYSRDKGRSLVDY